MVDRLSVDVGGLRLANPVIAGSGEHMIDEAGVLAAIRAGAGAVVVKSVNEHPAAGAQLGHTDYALFDAEWNRLQWNHAPPADANLLNRSGLYPGNFDRWVDQTSRLVSSQGDSKVIPSVIPGDYAVAASLVARVVDTTKSEAVEVNVGAPHGREAASGVLALEHDLDTIRELIGSIRAAVSVPLWVKITGQSDSVDSMAAAAFDGGANAVTLITRHMGMLPDLEAQKPALGTMLAYGGAWALPITCRWLALTRDRVGPQRSLIGTHGARSGGDVARMMLAGATAVQLTSAVFTGGYEVLSSAVTDLDRYLTDRNQSAEDIVGLAADALEGYTDQRFDESAWRRFVPPT